MFHAAKVPDPSTYGPPEGPVDHKMLARMRDHWEQFPDCNQSAAQHNLILYRVLLLRENDLSDLEAQPRSPR